MTKKLTPEVLSAIVTVHQLADDRLAYNREVFSKDEIDAVDAIAQWLYGDNASLCG